MLCCCFSPLERTWQCREGQTPFSAPRTESRRLGEPHRPQLQGKERCRRTATRSDTKPGALGSHTNTQHSPNPRPPSPRCRLSRPPGAAPDSPLPPARRSLCEEPSAAGPAPPLTRALLHNSPKLGGAGATAHASRDSPSRAQGGGPCPGEPRPQGLARGGKAAGQLAPVRGSGFVCCLSRLAKAFHGLEP